MPHQKQERPLKNPKRKPNNRITSRKVLPKPRNKKVAMPFNKGV